MTQSEQLPPDKQVMDGTRLRADALLEILISSLPEGDAARIRALAGTPDALEAIAAIVNRARLTDGLKQQLGMSLALEDTLAALDRGLQPLAPHDGIAVYLRQDERLKPAYINGVDSHCLSSRDIPLGSGVSGRAAATGQAVLNGDPQLDCPAATLGSAMAVPLEEQEKVIGVVTLHRAGPCAFCDEDMRVVRDVCAKASRAVANAVAYRRAEQAATTDPVTSLPTARALFQHLDAELSRCRRRKGTLAVLVCDLTGFDVLHRRFGWAYDRRILECVASGLRLICREYDYVAWTGDEFVLVLSDFAPQDARDKQIQIEALVEEAAKDACGESALGVVVGAAFYPDDGADAEDLLAKADRRLYLARPAQRDAGLATLGWVLDGNS